jgi:putative membrane protein
VALMTLPVAAQAPAPAGPDQELVRRLHQLGQDEIAMAGMGESRGVRAGVRTFADRVERDHRAADERLMAYAARKNMNRTAVAEPGGALEHDTLAMAPLANCSRSEFDYNFASKMVADHQAAIDAAAAAERLAQDPELKALINGNIKMMTEHLLSAQELAAAIPAPAPARVLELPAYPAGVSRTRTGADNPPPGVQMRVNVAPAR